MPNQIYTDTHHLVYEKKVEMPSTIVVDNNDGFMLYRQLPDGYKNTSLSYSNIKECMGINFYCSNESIGACIFRNGILYSITDSTLIDFFTIDLPDTVETSLVSAMQIDEDTIYVAAVANVNPASDDLVFASKTISYKGLTLSATTTIQHVSTTEVEISNHETLFNPDGSFNTSVPEIEYVTYEDYNGSHGFGDVSVVELGSVTTTVSIMNQIITDVSGFNDDFSSLPQDELYALDTFMSYDHLHAVGFSKDDLYLIEDMKTSPSGAAGTSLTYPFKKQNQQTEFMNVYFQPLNYTVEKGLYQASKYDSLYAPAGVFKKYKTVSNIAFCRLEMGSNPDGTVFNSISTYFLDVDKESPESLNKDAILDENDEITPVYDLDTGVSSFSDLEFSMFSSQMAINNPLPDTEVLAKNRGTVHLMKPVGTYSNQKVDIISVKSMCNFMDYGSPIE